MSRHASKEPRRFQLRYFVCSRCGHSNEAIKSKRKTAAGHIKTMYCPFCKTTTDQTQIEE